MQNRRCDNCKFWAKGEINATQIGQQSKQCRRMPPVVFPVNTPQGLVHMTTWPTTQPHDYCGEFDIALMLKEVN